MATLGLSPTSLAEKAMQSASTRRDELALAVMISLDCRADSLESFEARFPGKVLWWLGLKDEVTLYPRTTPFHRKHGIPDDASLLDYVVVVFHPELPRNTGFAVAVQHRNSTPELREFFERVDMENQND